MNDEIRCKICDRLIFYNYRVGQDMWYHCACGCVFNNKQIDKKEVFNEEYKIEYDKLKGIKDRYSYYIRTYMNFIEEKTYGRKFLDVGFCLDYNILEMRERGWLATGIDLIKNPYITGDFEHYDFGKERFDLIFMADVLQCLDNPVKAIYKAYSLLQPRGMLFIVTPNTDLLYEEIVSSWEHWNIKENRQLLSEQNLLDILARVDKEMTGRFKVILKHNTESKRFISWNNIHIIAQKEKIEEFKR